MPLFLIFIFFLQLFNIFLVNARQVYSTPTQIMHLRIGSQLLINIFDFVSFSFGTHRQRFLFCCIHTLESALFKGLRSCLLLIVWLLDRQRG